jgi:hypothetical protein
LMWSHMSHIDFEASIYNVTNVVAEIELLALRRVSILKIKFKFLNHFFID